jgi:hypothetical protein
LVLHDKASRQVKGEYKMGNVVSIVSGAHGFDESGYNLTAEYAACAAGKGMSFVGRYVPLAGISAAGDLTSAEAVALTENGLAILVVQHCHVAGTTFPNYTTQGTLDGNAAVTYLNGIGAPAGTFIYCDIENFANAADAVAWADAWAAVINAGTSPYWAAYYGPQNVLSGTTATWHGLWENVVNFGGGLAGANIAQSASSPLSCNTGIAVDADTMVTALGGFWGL